MKPTVTLLATHDEFAHVWAAAHGVQGGRAARVKVDRKALMAVLLDHSKLIAAYKNELGGIK